MNKIFYIYISKYSWEKFKKAPDESLTNFNMGNIKELFLEEIKKGKSSNINFNRSLTENYIRVKVTLEEEQ